MKQLKLNGQAFWWYRFGSDPGGQQPRSIEGLRTRSRRRLAAYTHVLFQTRTLCLFLFFQCDKTATSFIQYFTFYNDKN